MQTFTSKPAGPLTTAILARMTTAATVEFKVEIDRQIFVPASLEAGCRRRDVEEDWSIRA
jgi:hypothetical protein